MEGKAKASCDNNELDPLSLTLGSIYAAAAAASSADGCSASGSLPPQQWHDTHKHRRCRCSSLTDAAGCSARHLPPPQQWLGIHLRRRCSSSTATTSSFADCSAHRPSPRQPCCPSPRRPCINPRADAGNIVQAPFPWATERPGQHDTLQSLLCWGFTSVEGQARCKRCSARKAIAYDLESKFWEVREYIVMNRHVMYHRAPKAWECPVLPNCDACGHKGAWPEIATDKHEINWLFLFLGQMFGCCTLEQLKYFCMNNGQHHTGAKNRVLYYAYIEMSNQLLSFD